MITVFIGTFNRLDSLERTVTSYERFPQELELVICDNGTENPEALAVLARLERHPLVKKIYSLPRVYTMEEITDNFNVAVRDQYLIGDAEWFAISEADISFEQTDPAAMGIYLTLAEHFHRAVGPHLRVDKEIPWTYPFRSRVLATESQLVYRSSMKWIDIIPYSEWQIDTTFHLFPRTVEFRRLHMNPLRVGYPYDAMHLDWYLNIFEPTRENEIYIQNERGIGSWGRLWLSDFWWRFQSNPEDAFETVLNAPRINGDLCNTAFVLSWCYQYGAGCEQDLTRSRAELHRAVPNAVEYHEQRYWRTGADWTAMIYDNDFSALGWHASD